MSGSGVRMWAAAVNAMIVVFVVYSMLNRVYGFLPAADFSGRLHPLLYYTNWSNILYAAAAACTLVCMYKGVALPRAVAILKLASVMMLTVTFLVVVLFIAPNLGWQMFYDPGGMLFVHCLVPVLAAVDFIFLADIGGFDNRDELLALVPMACYAVGIIIILMVAGDDSLAPYPFLKIHTLPVYATVLFAVIFFAVGFGLIRLYVRLAGRFNPHAGGRWPWDPHGISES